VHNSGAGVEAKWADLILIEKPSAAPNENTSIPVKLCSTLRSDYRYIGTNRVSLAYRDFHYNGHAGRDYLSIVGGNGIAYTQNGKICRYSEINLKKGFKITIF
jgi:hypothetical protein